MSVHPAPDPILPGQTSVWSLPRPSVAEPEPARLRVVFAAVTIADTTRGVRTLETSHPPSYYLPPDDIADGVLRPAQGSSFCEWKGVARYWDVVVGARVAERAAWSYPDPTALFACLRDHVAFYAAAMDACFVGEERATPQPGGFYGGWITSRYAGPFKGVPGSRFW